MDVFSQIVVSIAKATPAGVQMLGTGFFISTEGHIATTRHVIGHDPSNLVVILPSIQNFREYQDTTNNQCQVSQAAVLEVDPIRDLVIIKIEVNLNGRLPKLGSFDDIDVSEDIAICGFPHCVEGRRVLTYQKTEIGAKILLASSNIKVKHAVINTQTRPGQSGSPIFYPKQNKIIGVLTGAYVHSSGGGISLGGINPRELHQTTQCVSAEYLIGML